MSWKEFSLRVSKSMTTLKKLSCLISTKIITKYLRQKIRMLSNSDSSHSQMKRVLEWMLMLAFQTSSQDLTFSLNGLKNYFKLSSKRRTIVKIQEVLKT